VFGEEGLGQRVLIYGVIFLVRVGVSEVIGIIFNGRI
jgi:hypothetical protein